MTTSNESKKRLKACDKGKWSATNVFVMVFAFIVAWPIGLFILFWICSGRNVSELFSMAKSFWAKNFGSDNEILGFAEPANTDNIVFNEYQQTQYDRVREIKEEIKDRALRFYDFRSDAKRRADQEEFSQFMSSGPVAEG